MLVWPLNLYSKYASLAFIKRILAAFWASKTSAAHSFARALLPVAFLASNASATPLPVETLAPAVSAALPLGYAARVSPSHHVHGSLAAPDADISLVLRSCARPSHLKQAHARILTLGLHRRFPSLLSAAALSYLSLGLLDSSLRLFPSLASPSSFLFNVLIRGCASGGRFHRALSLYSTLLSSALRPDKFTFPFALRSCAALSDLQRGKLLHQQALCVGCANDVFVGAALIDMYSKCGDVGGARKVFDRMSRRDLVTWTSMISGYAHNGYSAQTLEFFRLMRCSDVEHNRVSFLSSLLACGRLGALRKGECTHGGAIKTGFEPHILVATAVVDMYAKCGSLELARTMFDSISCKDVVCWSAMIGSYGYHGLAREAISTFDAMVDDGVWPNATTFTSLLSACSHAGLSEEGEGYFHSMKEQYGLEPSQNHYACMVDMLGRAGKLREAEELVAQMPMEPDSSIWGSLLGACRIHGDLDLGERIADRMLEAEHNHSGYYVLISNIYAAKSRWTDVERVRKLMLGRRVSKDRGISLIEFKGQVHEFGVNDKSHPQSQEIYDYLDRLGTRMKQLGYVPLVDFTLHDVDDESKEIALSYHGERLAVAFGLMNMSHATVIRIIKNLRICGDCHNAIKLISRIENRSIVVRDTNRFHHFMDGVCSCGDYW